MYYKQFASNKYVGAASIALSNIRIHKGFLQEVKTERKCANISWKKGII
jgi:hypothetical protein